MNVWRGAARLALSVALLGSCGAPEGPTPYAGSVGALLGSADLVAGLPAGVPVADAGLEATAGAIRTCRWGPAVLLSLGPYRALIDATADINESDTFVRGYYDGVLGVPAMGVKDSVLVAVYIRTTPTAFSLTVSAYGGVTLDQLLALARLVRDRI